MVTVAIPGLTALSIGDDFSGGPSTTVTTAELLDVTLVSIEFCRELMLPSPKIPVTVGYSVSFTCNSSGENSIL